MTDFSPPPAPTPETAPAREIHHPTGLDLVAGALLAATVVLHVVAMIPAYYSGSSGQGSLLSQPDQAGLYFVLAAGWAAALGVGLLGPNRIAMSAGLAVGVAATELGFRVSDVLGVIHVGASQAGAGLWLMAAAWSVGALGAAAAVMAARRRARPTMIAEAPVAVTEVGASETSEIDEPGLEAGVVAAADVPAIESQPIPAAPPEPKEHSGISSGWTIVLGILALALAGAFMPAWDHYSGSSAATGQSLSANAGNAFADAWEVVLGNMIVVAALVLVPIAASRLRDRAVAAAAIVGVLVVMAGQFVSAVMQVDEKVPSSLLGLTPSQFSQAGWVINLKLTGWFVLDALAALVLLAAVMVWATARTVQENSPATRPSAPEAFSEAMSPGW